MKKLIMSAVLGAIFTLTHTNVQAANPPYIDYAYVGSQYGSPFFTNGKWYENYEITVVLDYPQPYVDDIDWYAYDVTGSTTVLIQSGTASWPSPSGDGCV
jgi:hypothetical protein